MEAKIEGDMLTIKIRLTEGTISSSGKSLVVATSGGFIPIPGSELKISFNVIKQHKG